VDLREPVTQCASNWW